MKSLLLAIALFLSVDAYCQKYTVGLIKNGSVVKNIEGEIVVSDSTVTSTLDGKKSVYKILSRKGYTIHFTDGKEESKYVINHSKGRLHGFTYDRSIHYHHLHHSSLPNSVFLCAIKND